MPLNRLEYRIRIDIGINKPTNITAEKLARSTIKYKPETQTGVVCG